MHLRAAVARCAGVGMLLHGAYTWTCPLQLDPKVLPYSGPQMCCAEVPWLVRTSVVFMHEYRICSHPCIVTHAVWEVTFLLLLQALLLACFRAHPISGVDSQRIIPLPELSMLAGLMQLPTARMLWH